jgi:hypothetical protein
VPAGARSVGSLEPRASFSKNFVWRNGRYFASLDLEIAVRRLFRPYLIEVLLSLSVEAQEESLRQAGSLLMGELKSFGFEISKR